MKGILLQLCPLQWTLNYLYALYLECSVCIQWNLPIKSLIQIQMFVSIHWTADKWTSEWKTDGWPANPYTINRNKISCTKGDSCLPHQLTPSNCLSLWLISHKAISLVTKYHAILYSTVRVCKICSYQYYGTVQYGPTWVTIWSGNGLTIQAVILVIRFYLIMKLFLLFLQGRKGSWQWQW